MRYATFSFLVVLFAVEVTADDHPPLAKAPFSVEQAKEFQQEWAKHIDKLSVHTNSIGMKLTLVPPGEFMMGVSEETMRDLVPRLKKSSNQYERGSWSGLLIEMPAHRVRITKPFYMASTEVTVAQFRQFAEESGYKTEAERGLVYGQPYQGKTPIRTWRKTFYQQPDDHPVLQLSWRDCVEFCKWLSKKEAQEGHEYCLPSEAEWEYACRAGTTTVWHFGGPDDYDKIAHEYSWASWDSKKTPRPIAVGQKKPNAFGLYDMHGNIWEYTADWLDDYYYLESPINDPTGPPTFNEIRDWRVMIRGGSFDCGHYWSRATMRIRIRYDSNQHPHMGFRVAMRMKGVDGVPPATEPNVQIVRNEPDSVRVKPRDPVAAQRAAVTEDRPLDLKIDLGDGTSMEFVLIPAGSFLMGSHKGGRYERPVHEVTISQPFYIGKYEVTQGQWDAVMGNQDRTARWGAFKPRPISTGPNKAMCNVSWNECEEFVARLRDSAPGRHFSLPTEAKWEYACRADSTTEYHFGNDSAELSEYALVCADDAPHPRKREDGAFDTTVGMKKTNSWGVYDMHGNVHEFCADWFGKDYYASSPGNDPQGPATGYARVVRGGSFGRYGRAARSAYRFFALPGPEGRGGRTGFRLVLTVSDDSKEDHADPALVAHRGLLRHAPENTLPAFAACLELGIGFELDIRTTKDGKLVVLHDDTLGRTTNGPNRSVREFTLAQLKAFDAGSWFQPSFADVRVPTLEETFALIKERRRDPTIIALNVKDITRDGEKRLIELVEKYGLLNESFAFDQSDESSRRLKALNPKFRIGANVNRKTVESRLKEELLDVFLVTFVPTTGEVDQLHQHGKQVVYNFGGSGEARRNPSTWTKAKQSGIDGMLTDFPLECRLHWRAEAF